MPRLNRPRARLYAPAHAAGGERWTVSWRMWSGLSKVYLSSLGGKVPRSGGAEASPDLIRKTILTTLKTAARGEIEAYGPRGGKRWSPRYFVRRDAWHVLDHLWEIEDRLITE